MKRIASIIAGSLFAALFAGGALTTNAKAQTEPGVIFTVPFAFAADGYTIDAGTYEISLVSGQHLISIRNLNTGDKQIFSVRPELQRTIASQGLLVFHRCGQRKDLAEFHIPGASLYSTTIAPRHRKASELETCSSEDTTTIAAR
jgi:hypothetical protein